MSSKFHLQKSPSWVGGRGVMRRRGGHSNRSELGGNKATLKSRVQSCGSQGVGHERGFGEGENMGERESSGIRKPK